MTDWKTTTVGDCIVQVPFPAKVPRQQFLQHGAFPIISQEADFINGYWNQETDVLRVDEPVVVFGDHTQVLKYVDFDFVVGADGVKVLKPVHEIDPKFFYYQLMAKELPALGYARHFRLLREQEIAFPDDISEQQRIVTKLDAAFAALAEAQAHVERNRANARELFESYLNGVFEGRGDDWRCMQLQQVSKFIDYRGRTPDKTSEGLRLITAKNVRKGHLQREPEEFVAADSYEKWMTRGIPEYGDVLFTTEAPLANVAQLDTHERVVFAQRIIILQPDTKLLNKTFLKYAILSKPMQDAILSKATGATVSGIKASLLKLIEVSFPSLAEQAAIVSRLESIEQQAKQLESTYQQKLMELGVLKKGLLGAAFRGEL